MKEVKEIREIIREKEMENNSHEVITTTNKNISDSKNPFKNVDMKQEETKESDKKDDMFDSDSDSDSDSGKKYSKLDSESLSELDLSKKTTNKVN